MKNIAKRSWLLVCVTSLLLVPATTSALELTDCKGALVPSQESGCSGIDDVGCCDQFGRTIYCQGGDLYCIDCTEGFQFCGWNLYGYYDCGQPEGLADPSGNHALACGGGECPAQCHVDSPCSSECSGGCGHCPADGICLDDGSCYTPKCDGKECGKDPAGFSCGTCGNGTECVDALGKCMALPNGCVTKDGPGCKNCGCEACVCEVFPSCCTENWDILCVAACQNDCNYDCSPCPAEPSCEGLECGDYCGVNCGKCAGGKVCSQFQCCSPSCSGKECGSDGCGGICGTCPGTDECAGGSCVACQPDCEGKECGGDGCGGGCGQCAGGAQCMEQICVSESCVGSCGGQSPFECFCDDQCVKFGDCCEDVCSACPNICEDGCNGVGWAGCCDGATVKWCQDDELHEEDCGDKPSCGWNAKDGYYDCETTGGADPSGEFPLACDEVCIPICFGKECGDDGCGEVCGNCASKWAVCTDQGQCCESSCADKVCGDDGCGGSCGACAEGLSCDGSACVEGIPAGCFPSEEPGCGGCGCEACVIGQDDYCGNNSWDAVCATACEELCGADCPCIPACDGKDCGADGCGGVCGECEDGLFCTGAGKCSDDCFGSCSGKECGDDGCGESCGGCKSGQHCSEGQCQPDCDGVPWEGCCDGTSLSYCDGEDLVVEDCEGNLACGWKGEFYDCGTAGGDDPEGLFAISCEGYCEPKCGEKVCGPDGCGGSCGDCGEGDACLKGECVESSCGGLAYEGCCAVDDVLWWCENAEPKKLSCEGKGPCGWNVADGYYNCATDGESDPSGLHPMECPPGIGCQPDCVDRTCGNDGCNGSCGTCAGGSACVNGECPVGGPDVIDVPDASADVGSAKETTLEPKTKGGGCTVGSDPAAGSLLLLLLLMGLLVSRRKVVATSLALVVFVVACGSSNSGTYTPDPDIVKAVDVAVEDSMKLDVELVDVAADSLPDVIADTSSGELKPPPPMDLQAEVEVVDVEEDTGPEFNCHDIPQGPFELVRMTGVIASEDLAFDSQGFVVGSDNKVIFKSDIAGNSHIFSPNMEFRAGLAMLPNGWLVVNDNELNRLVKIDPDGVQYTLLTGLDYPNGIAVDMQGYIYITEEYANRVLRVHSYTGEYTVLTNAISHPNGICFNKDYTGLYIGSFGGGGWVYYMSLSPEGKPGKVIKWGDMTDTAALLDGIAVDYCGNVYVCEYAETEVYRFSPDGQHREKIVDATEQETYLPNLRFGAGPGWNSTSLYAPDGWHPKDGVWRIDIGVPAPKLPFP
jgi:MYXO-CTERM domain-containing protein